MGTGFDFAPRDVLLVVDVINTFDHEDGERLLASFREHLGQMCAVIAAARRNGTPVVYVNDEPGRWASDFPGLIREVRETGHAADVVDALAPERGDHVLLKHRYSAFDHTPLELLLEELQAERLVVIGAATEGCIVQTAIDAREFGLKTSILVEACATTDQELEALALDYAERVVGARIERASAPRA